MRFTLVGCASAKPAARAAQPRLCFEAQATLPWPSRSRRVHRGRVSPQMRGVSLAMGPVAGKEQPLVPRRRAKVLVGGAKSTQNWGGLGVARIADGPPPGLLAGHARLGARLCLQRGRNCTVLRCQINASLRGQAGSALACQLYNQYGRLSTYYSPCQILSWLRFVCKCCCKLLARAPLQAHFPEAHSKRTKQLPRHTCTQQ